MNPILFSMIAFAAFVGFFYFAAIKLGVIRSLQPTVRWDRPFARFKKVVSMGFLQSRMIRGDWKPGVMHATIFWGFTILLVRKIQLFVIAFDENFVYPGLAGGVYASLKDLTELLVMGAVGFAFYRRLVLKPRRFEPNREALLVLSLIMVIMVTDFFYDGFKFALNGDLTEGLRHERSFAFIGGSLGSLLSGLPHNWLELGYHGFYWVQIVTVFGFLVFIPMGEHFHIVTALPALFFSRNSPLNETPKVDLEALMSDEDDGEEEPKVGVHTAKDLLWKDALDVFTCTECGRCKEACPTFLTDKPLSLKWVNDSLKHHLLDHRDTLGKDEADIGEDELPPLVGEIISEDTLWACTTCGYCEMACPIELEHLGKFYRMRQHKVMMDGEFPEELQSAFDNYERQSNPWGVNSEKRGEWAEGLNVPIIESAEQVKDLDYVFFTGSAQAYDSRNQKVAKAFVKILEAAGVKFAIFGPKETSTGECVRRAGNEMLFQELAAQLVETLNEHGVEDIVTCDPHVFNALKNEYPEFGGQYRVIHHSQLIDRLLQEGRIRVSEAFERVIFHEPCYLGRHNGEYQAPRNVLDRVTKDEPLEFDLNRERSMCCGAGGARMWMEETIGKRINVERVDQALPHSPEVIATACPYCAVMITDGVAHHGREESIQTKDIAELVAEALVTEV